MSENEVRRKKTLATAIVAVVGVVLVGGVALTRTETRNVPVLFARALAVRETTSDGAEAELFARRRPPGPLPKLWHAPDFDLVDQRAREVTLASLRGRPFIADFFFSGCRAACPTLTSKMVMLERRLASKDVGFVSFSVDPAHDTPPVLAAYAGRWNAAEPRWSLLATTPSSLAELTRGFRVTAAPSGDPDSPIVHSELFFLVDGEGNLRGVYDSADPDAMADLAPDADSLAQPAVSPPPPDSLYVALGCGGCHDDPRTAPPLVNLRGSRARLEGDATAEVDAAYVRRSVLEPARDRVAGYTVAMPSYAGALDDAALDRLVAEILARASADAGPRAADAQVGVDPVCGMKVRIEPDAPHAEHEGKPYYFCSSTCRDSFLKTPEKYVGATSPPRVD